MGVLARSRNPILRLDFSKIRFFALFLEYIFFNVSYGSDFFTDVKNNVRRTFWMVIKCLENFLEPFEKKVSSEK